MNFLKTDIIQIAVFYSDVDLVKGLEHACPVSSVIFSLKEDYVEVTLAAENCDLAFSYLKDKKIPYVLLDRKIHGKHIQEV